MRRFHKFLLVVAGLPVALGTMACSSAVPTETPGVDRLGQYILRQEGPEVDAVLGYKYASSTVGDDWLILELAVTAPAKTTTKIDRANIWVQDPDGTKIPLSSQKLFGQDYAVLRKTIKAADIARDPMDYFPPSRRPCELEFFAQPGEAVTFDTVSVNDRRECQGRLFFKVPGGIKPGHWVFGMDLVESTVRIPFEL